MPAYAFPDKQSYDKMARVVKLRGGLEGGLPSQNIRVREALPRLAKVVTAEIAAGAAGSAQLQKPDWTDSAEAVITAQNDSAISLAIGTKVYVQPIQGEWRIVSIYQSLPPATYHCTFVVKSGPVSMKYLCEPIWSAPVHWTELPGQDSNGDIEIADPLGCFFNEDPADLVGRQGYAMWMYHATESAGWVVHSLCCPPPPEE